MRITFVHYENENPGIEYLSSILKRNGHKVFLAFAPRLFGIRIIEQTPYFKKILGEIRKELIEKVIISRPELVAFSVYTQTYSWAQEIAKAIKKRIKVPIIFGGIHTTLLPETVIKNDCVDMICVGEGEDAIVDLANSLKQGKPTNYRIPNIWFKKNGQIIKNEVRPVIEDLDSIPLPDKELFYEQQPFMKKLYGLMTSRGCPFSCSYCHNSVLKKIYAGKGKYIRRRSVSNVLTELTWAKEKFKPKYIYFADANFVSVDMDWLKKLLSRYKKEIGLPFWCRGHPDLITKETVKLLKEAGCFILTMGIESVSEDIRKRVLKRPGSNKQIEFIARVCRQYKLRFSIDHIFNIPYETIKEQIDALEFYNSIRPRHITVYRLIYFPKLEIIEKALESGNIDKETIARINMGKYVRSSTSGNGSIFKSEKEYRSFMFLFTVLPSIPRFLIKAISNKRELLLPFMKPSFIRAAYILKIGIRVIISKRRWRYIGEIKNLIYRLLRAIKNRKDK